jgi:epoxide hydrolase 4
MARLEVVDRLAILNAAHPRKLSEGLHHPGQLRKSWYFFFFFFFFFFVFVVVDLPDLPETVVHAGRWHFFRHFLHDASPAYTPEEMDRSLQAWSQPGAATGMINYYRPRCGPRPNRPKRRCAPSRRPRWSSGGRPIATSARNSPSPTTTCPAWTASDACPTPRTGCIHDEAERVTHLLTGFFAPALAKWKGSRS